MTATSKTESGAAGKFSGPAEYAFARRFRQKLLLSYLSQQGLHPTFQSMVQQTDGHMCGGRLRRLVSRGQWADVLNYLHRFNSRRTVASNALYLFLHTIWALDNAAAAAAARNGSVKSSAHRHGMTLSMVISRCPKLGSLVKGMLDSPQQCVSLEWKPIRITAAVIAYRLAREDPDLNRMMQLPGDGQMSPHHVLPISRRPRRRHVKRPPRRCAPGPAIARLYLSKRRSVHSSTPHTPAFMDESLDRVAGLVDECLEAGKRQKLHQWAPLQSFERVPGYGMLLLTPPGAPASLANSRTTSVPNAGAPASSGTLTNQAKNSGISLAQVSGVHVRV